MPFNLGKPIQYTFILMHGIIDVEICSIIQHEILRLFIYARQDKFFNVSSLN